MSARKPLISAGRRLRIPMLQCKICPTAGRSRVPNGSFPGPRHRRRTSGPLHIVTDGSLNPKFLHPRR